MARIVFVLVALHSRELQHSNTDITNSGSSEQAIHYRTCPSDTSLSAELREIFWLILISIQEVSDNYCQVLSQTCLSSDVLTGNIVDKVAAGPGIKQPQIPSDIPGFSRFLSILPTYIFFSRNAALKTKHPKRALSIFTESPMLSNLTN